MTTRTNKTTRLNLENLDRRDLPSVAMNLSTSTGPMSSTPIVDDGYTAEEQPPAIVVASQPRIERVVFGDGTKQRSMVNSISISLSQPIKVSDELTSIFQLHRSQLSNSPGTNDDVDLVVSSDSDISTNFKLTFQGRMTECNGSLVDGIYDFTIDSSRASVVGDLGGQLDHGVKDDVLHVTGSTSNKWFRLAGDSNGDAVINQIDFSAFRSVYGLGGCTFDLNGDGLTDQTDIVSLRNQYGARP